MEGKEYVVKDGDVMLFKFNSLTDNFCELSDEFHWMNDNFYEQN